MVGIWECICFYTHKGKNLIYFTNLMKYYDNIEYCDDMEPLPLCNGKLKIYPEIFNLSCLCCHAMYKWECISSFIFCSISLPALFTVSVMLENYLLPHLQHCNSSARWCTATFPYKGLLLGWTCGTCSMNPRFDLFRF